MTLSLIKSHRGFTLTELVVVVTILVVLSGVAFISYSSFNASARDSARTADMGNLKVILQSAKQKKWSYPKVTGTDTTTLTRSSLTWAVIATQGRIYADMALGENSRTYLDPKTKAPYLYSSSQSGQDYQIGMTLEGNEDILTALIDGSYLRILTSLPSLIVATSTGSLDIDTGVGTSSFVVNGSVKNLPYDLSGIPLKSASSLTEILGSAGFTSSTSYRSCQEIYESGRSSGSGTYVLRNSSGSLTQTGCTMVF